MKVLELFAGTCSIGKAFGARGHEVLSIDWDDQFEGCVHCDVSAVTAEWVLGYLGRPDVIWASPDCTTYSIAAISHHRYKDARTGELRPKSDYAKQCDKVNKHVHKLIHELQPKFWFIENPRGGMRKMRFMEGMPRYTVTYCQYGDKRMKPTDIWTNHPDPQFKPPCRNGAPCHESAPRSSTVRKMKAAGMDVSHIGGTQYGLDSSVERSRIPKRLCEHIVDICEKGLS